MRYEIYTCGPFLTNGYLLLEDGGETCIFVDPGLECEEVLDGIVGRGLRVSAIVNTHGHVDHAYGNAAAIDRLGAPLLAHEADLPLLERMPDQAGLFGFDAPASPKPDRFLADGDTLDLGAETLRVLHTPGHSPGGICLVSEAGAPPVAVVGDTIFAGSIGRTDLWGGDFELLARSIREKLYVLPDETVLLPGHGPETLVGRERATNPFVRGDSG
jgi:glyoxylase-like metal-dependent hydrolase (beta-lactamase superfamily II)